LSLAEIEERHPEQAVRALTELHRALSTVAVEATPDPQSSWGPLRSRLPERGAAVIDIPQRGRRWALTRRRVAALGLAAALTLTGGLAAAGVLPAPAQDAIANVAGHVGLHLPSSGQTSHGQEVSHTARSTTTEGCEKGRRVSEEASSSGRAHRSNTVVEPNPCEKSQGHSDPSGAGSDSATGGGVGSGSKTGGAGSGSGTVGGSSSGGPPHVRGAGADRHGTHGPPG
jgi:hypothetical protein